MEENGNVKIKTQVVNLYLLWIFFSLSAQTSVAIGAVINASFGSIVEIIIFVVALNQGKQSGVQLCFTEIVKASLTGRYWLADTGSIKAYSTSYHFKVQLLIPDPVI